MTVNSELVSFEARINNVLKRATEAGIDEELRSSLARYACVLTSGYLEESVRIIVGTWCRDKSHPHIHTYVGRQLDWFLNPKLGKILEILSHFSLAWNESFADLLTDEEKDAINSVVNNRNQIAHGRNVGISPEPMKRYFKSCKSAMHKLDRVVNDRGVSSSSPFSFEAPNAREQVAFQDRRNRSPSDAIARSAFDARPAGWTTGAEQDGNVQKHSPSGEPFVIGEQ